MNKRLNYFTASPNAMNTMMLTEKYLASAQKEPNSLEYNLVELVKTRVSQINGCAYCLDMHTKDARANSETEQRLNTLSAWREAPFYTDKERAALAWAEALTLVHKQDIDDGLYDHLKTFFNDKQLVDLTITINTINSWNRIAKCFKPEVGTYQPGDFNF